MQMTNASCRFPHDMEYRDVILLIWLQFMFPEFILFYILNIKGRKESCLAQEHSREIERHRLSRYLNSAATIPISETITSMQPIHGVLYLKEK